MKCVWRREGGGENSSGRLAGRKWRKNGFNANINIGATGGYWYWWRGGWAAAERKCQKEKKRGRKFRRGFYYTDDELRKYCKRKMKEWKFEMMED